MNALAPLLVALGRAGIELARHPADAARLRHRPADLPHDLSARLRMHRAAVVGLLVDGYAPDPHGDTDAGYVLGERLGVADGLGMPTHPGSAAWLLAVAESIGLPEAPAESPPAPGIVDRLGGIVAAALGAPVRASTLPPGGRFPGEPGWGRPVDRGNSCHRATHGVHSGHGSTGERNTGGGEGERSNALRDRQGRGRGP